MEYNFTAIEDKWKKFWAEQKTYLVTEDASKPKYYVLDMFPYPSGAGLHVGHPLGYVASDIYARYKRMSGYNVLHPMGYDAFGLPAEQYAIETGTHPALTTEKAIRRYREQLDKIGFSFDWDRQVKTCEPDYYKWTQWIFLQLFNSWYNREKNKAEKIETLIEGFEKWGCTAEWIQFDETLHPTFSAEDWKAFLPKQKEHILQFYRLAFRSYTEVNWCDALGCVLANDEVKDGKSERGGHPVTRKKMRQWSLRITEYADRLLEGLNRIDWSESLKEQQRNWIGRSEGCLLSFKVLGRLNTTSPAGSMLDGDIEVFTTRIDTIFGVTFLVVAPEHPMIDALVTGGQQAEMEAYLKYVNSRSDIERQQEKKITGCFTGSYASHPVTGEKLPIWTAEYVLAGYGTGAIMAVPADDERDRKFAEKFGLQITEVIDKSMYPGASIEDKLGKMINSDFLNGLEVKEAIETMLCKVEELGIGQRKVNYKLRDASYSRQRYWGEPFPIKYNVQGEVDSPFPDDNQEDDADIPVALTEVELPLVLPEVETYKPTGDGRSPLANSADWVKNGYETDTMPGYAGSSWYFLRYMDAKNPNEFAAKDKLDYWQDVDIYFGGAEHAVGHLLYSRFWHKVLFDLGYVPTDEPFKKLVNQGMIQGKSGYVYRLGYDYFVNPSGEHKMPKSSEPPSALDEYSKNVQVPVIYVSKEIYHRAENNALTQYDIEAIKAKMTEAKQMLIEKGIHGELDFPYGYSFTKLNEYAHNFDDEKLIIDTFMNSNSSRLGNENSLLVTNENGDVLSEREPEKMSKSKYNVVNPDDVIERFGADCFRMFEMFLGPIEQSKPWDDKGINGVSNFLRKFWRLFYSDTNGWQVTNEEPTPAEYKALHKTIKKVTEGIERLSYNTAVSAFMIGVNELTALNCHKHKILEPLSVLIAPFAPFMAEELWHTLGNASAKSVHSHAKYPLVNEQYLTESSFDYPVSVNGKVRANLTLPLDLPAEEVQQQTLHHETIQKWTNGAVPKKFIFVKGKIINVVV